jgi:hypothetical protein
MEPLQNLVGVLWRGELPLWVAFWVYGQGVYAVILAAYIAMYKLSFDLLAGVREKMAGMDPWLVVPVKVLATVVNIADALGFALITTVWFVMVWRSAVNTDWVGWTFLARGFVVMVAVLLGLGAVVLWKAR